MASNNKLIEIEGLTKIFYTYEVETHALSGYRLNNNPIGNLCFRDGSRLRNYEIGLSFQSFNLIGDLTVEENVETTADLTSRHDASGRAQEAR